MKYQKAFQTLSFPLMIRIQTQSQEFFLSDIFFTRNDCNATVGNGYARDAIFLLFHFELSITFFLVRTLMSRKMATLNIRVKHRLLSEKCR